MSGTTQKIKAMDRKILRFIKVQIVLLLILVAGVSYYYVSGYAAKVSEMKTEASQIVRKSTPDTFRQTETSEVYDSQGNTISVLKGEKDVYYVEFSHIPAYVTQAIISIEDKKFYKHDGVDYKAILRALIAAAKNGEATQGASTITQQLARTMFLTSDKTWERKVEEIYIASELEKKYSKDQILEFYLNNIYFANGYYGIQAAAKGYFSKDISDLSLSESCYLLAIPNSPSYYDPVVNSKNTIKRRNRILEAMYHDNMIGDTTYAKALMEEIQLDRSASLKNNYVETYVYYCATKALMEQDGFVFKNEFEDETEQQAYEEKYKEAYEHWNQTLFTAGYRIYTTIDLQKQKLLQEAIDRNLEEFTDLNDEGIYALQSAAVCIDNETGKAVAIVGGRSQDVKGYTLNRAFQSFRQPGSAIKPLLVYTPAIERGYTADSLVVDEKIEEGPENASGSYSGEITLREAVAKSKNTIAWKLYEELTSNTAIPYLKKLGFEKITNDDYGMAACLGGLTIGVSPLEMAKGYAAICNDGYMRDPGCISKITDAKGDIIYEETEEEIEVYKENGARMMTDMLQSVVTSGTAKGIKLGDIPVAGKTGTTNSNRDGWFVGYTSYYTTSVWVGYDIPKKVPGLKGSSYPASIWQDYMQQIHEGLLPIAFKKPVEYIGEEEQQADVDALIENEVEEETELPEAEEFGQFDEEQPAIIEQPAYHVITQTFNGEVVPEGIIPENATDIEIQTITEIDNENEIVNEMN